MGWAVSLDGIDDYIDLGALGDLGKNIGSAKINITFRTPKDYAPGNLTVLAGTVNDTTIGLNLAIRLNAERYLPNPTTYAPGKTNFFIRVRSETTSRIIEGHINNNVLYDGDYHTLIVDYTDINNSNLRVYVDGILQTIQHYALKDNIVTSPDNIQYGLAVGASNSRGVIELNSQVDILSVKVILNDQPYAEYPIDEGQGNIIHDISGNDYHGTIHGATWGWVDDPLNLNLDIVSDFRAKAHIGLKVETLPATNIGSKSMTLNGKLKGLGNYAGAECSFQYYPVDQYKNYALKFDGVDGRISFNKAIIPTDGGPWTISFMAKIDSLSTGQSSVISQYAPESDNRFSIHANFDSGYWSMVQEPALGVVDIAPIVLGEVAYITVSYDGEKLKCYKNDICVTTVEISNLEILDLPTLIGNRNRTGYNDTFNGIIDELSVWSRALSKEEIGEHLHQELTGAEEGLITYYRFNEGEGDILHDCSRNYNDGIIHGAQWVDSPFKLMPPKEKLEITEKFSDDFDRSTLGPDWEITPDTQGSVQLQNGELVLTGDSSRRMWVRTTRTFEAHSIVFRARRDSADEGSDIGLAFNWDGNLESSGVGKLLNGYRLSWTVWENPSKLKIARYDNGVDTDLTSTEFPPDYNEHEFAILIEDGTIRVLVDDVQMLQVSDSTYTSGYIGLTAREGGNRRGRYNWIVVKGTKEEKVLMPTPLRETPSQKIYSPYTLVKTVTPKEVNGLYFDGVNDYVSIPHNAIIKPQHITIMAWVDRDDWSKVDTNDARIISCIESGGYGISCHSDGRISFALYIGGEYRYVYSSGPISPGLHFICATYDGKSLKLYIDGELDSETPYSGNISYSVNNHVTICAEPTEAAGVESGSYLSGVISNLSIWNRGLSEEEVSYYYNNELKGNEHGLVAYYKMDEGEGNKIYNSSLYKDEYNLDGTISGATWDIVSLPETKYEYKPGVKFSSIITPGEYKLVSSKGLSFDGVDDYVSTPQHESLRLQQHTLMCRIKAKDYNAYRGILEIAWSRDGHFRQSRLMTFGNNSIRYHPGYLADSNAYIEYSNLPVDEEIFLTATYDGSSIKGYLNGKLIEEKPFNKTLSYPVIPLIYIGYDGVFDGAPRCFNGLIDNVSIWNRALTSEEVKLYYNKKLKGNEHGLVVYYPLDIDIGSGFLVDQSENRIHANIHGATITTVSPLYSLDIEPSGTRYYYRAVAKGLPDYALSFNGTSSYSEIGGRETTSPLAINEEYTCIVKFKTNVISSFRQPILSQNNNSGDYNFHSRGLAIRENQLRFWSRDSSRVLHEMTYPISPNTWYCAALVQDRNVIKGFLDGVSIGQLNMGSFMTGYESYHAIGTWTAGKTDFFDGSIKEVQIYNRALSEEEIKQYQEIQLVGNEPGLVAYYRIVEGEGDILVDHTMNQNHGTIYGATWEQL